MKEMVGGCCVCSDETGYAENPLVYCDGQGCTVAVHQACYGIVTVPTGPWFCRKCESQERAARVRCELCPIKDGALKRTDSQAWAHVVCALYIPEVRFGNVTTMEPIILQLIPPERYNRPCYICEQQGKGSRAMIGACMQCNKTGCKAHFHVTCAQGLGLLCEEAGNFEDNVKYCGYCQHHYSKLRKGGNVKQIPPYKANDSSEEKDEGVRKRKSQGGKAGGRGRNATPSPNLNKPGTVSPSPGSESGDHSRASTPAVETSTGANGAATKELLPPPTATGPSSVIKDPKEKDKEKEINPKEKDKDVPSCSVSSSASSSTAKFTTSNFVETVVTPSESVFGADGAKSATSVSGAKKRRNAGGTRTPPSQDKEIEKDKEKEKEKDVPETTTTTAALGLSSSSNSTNAAGTVKMEVDKSPASQDASGVEKGVKKLKIISEPNLSSLGTNSSAAEPPSKNPQNSSTSSNPVGSSVSSSANSIVVSVPLTAAVSLPSATGLTAPIATGINISASGRNATSSGLASTVLPTPMDTQPPRSNTSVKSAEVHGKRARSFSGEKSGKLQKQGKRKQRRGSQLSVRSAPSASASPSPSQTPDSVPPLASPTQTTPVTPPLTLTIPQLSVPSASSYTSPISPPILTSTTATYAPIPASFMSNPSLFTAPMLSSSPHPHPPGLFSSEVRPPGKRNRPHSTPAPFLINPQLPLHSVPAPRAVTPDIFNSSNISLKESPPSSPETVHHGRGRPKNRRGHHSNAVSSNHKDTKDLSLFQNGVTSVNAPHMLGNQLNPSSSMAQKMSDTLSAELEAHSIYNSESNNSNQSSLIGPPLPSRVIASARSAESSRGSNSANSALPQTLDQLLERQWEQGSQFLMEQAQHFDIASLLTCLHQLRSENTRLEENIRKLQARRDHLLAVNARLAIPLASQNTGPPTPPHGGSGPSPVNSVLDNQLPPSGGMPQTSVQNPSPLIQGMPQGPPQQAPPQALPQGLPQGHPQAHQQHGHLPGHPQSHPQGHQVPLAHGHLGAHSQALPQSHTQTLSSGHSQPHPHGHLPGHSSGHPSTMQQVHSQSHPSTHPQTMLQVPQSSQGRVPQQRPPSYQQQPLENGLPPDTNSLHQNYVAHQRPQPSPTIRHTQSSNTYMMSQTPPTSNPTSVVRSSSVSSDSARSNMGASGHPGMILGSQGYTLYSHGSAISSLPPQQVVMQREAVLHHAIVSKPS